MWRRPLPAAVLLALAALPAGAQVQTVGLFVNDEQASEGYTLFGPSTSTMAFLINNDGLPVHTWETNTDQRSIAYLLPNGHLLRAAKLADGSVGIRLQEFDWDGNVVWDYSMSDPQYRGHHDIKQLPNGNVLVVAKEVRTAFEAIAEGRDPLGILQGEVRVDFVVEVQPLPPGDGTIVWEWRAWDHLVQDLDPTKENFDVVANHPELIDINHGTTLADWTHFNGIDYNAQFDQIVVSARKFDEIWIIDHSTSTAEAAGHTGGNSGKGGDLLYRWGNPAAYGRGTAADQRLFGQHDPQWIPSGYPGAGNILVFNNGWNRPGELYSSVDEIASQVDGFGAYSIDTGAPFGPSDPVWTYTSTPNSAFYSNMISGAQRLPDGNTLICEGMLAHLFEVTASGDVVWDYVNPVDGSGPVAQGTVVTQDQRVAKVRRYPSDYPAFAGRDLTPGVPLELFDPPLPAPDGSLAAVGLSANGDPIQVDWDAGTCTASDYHLVYGSLTSVAAYELLGAECDVGTGGTHIWNGVPPGSLYFLVVGTDPSGIYESGWGQDSSGNPRNGGTASFQCGTTTKVPSSTCP